ncbi:hypothetical protein [Cupriavidus necator]
MTDTKLDLDAIERALIGSAMSLTFRECQALIARIRYLERELAKDNNAARLDGLSNAIATLERAKSGAHPGCPNPSSCDEIQRCYGGCDRTAKRGA